jgi:Xaa-Pro aminopeptidase
MGIEKLPLRDAAARRSYLQARLSSLGVDSFWVVRDVDVRYLTGFTGEDSTLLVAADRVVLVTDSRFEEQAQAEAGVEEVVCRRGAMVAAVARLCRRPGLCRIGFGSAALTHADWKGLGDALPGAQLVPFARCPVGAMRARKGREEVEAIRRALAISQSAFERLGRRLRPGMTERHLAGLLEWEMRQGGADEAAFKTICAAGERASLPHAAPTDRKAEANRPLLFDWGARAGGYNSDLTRLRATGTMPREVVELAQVVLEAQEAAFARLGPGVPCREVDHAARTVIVRAGYGRFFGHGLGHGVGLEVHEAPRLAAGQDDPLLPGMVLTIEPGIYLPGRAGVRIEDMVVITPDGYELLSSLERRPCGG